ncbi:hypothetical protein PLICRDRAFT_94891 [Plicaturopsis crispa FD-325 SS-3]|uniref:Aminoglycoside phosphotransferase domain-containing protein n=1 Tax=Plicaturopsis crispa FD-325 SS-3 TaxID=944288 RepID=A0A0C9T608_PLICR|nr:hypothetical protein PLICRDRAFT_94891 [Plicaturopsis crispa FD-325 SS-3]
MSSPRKRVRRPPPPILSDEERFVRYGIRPTPWWRQHINAAVRRIRRISWVVIRSIWCVTGGLWLFIKISRHNPEAEAAAIRYVRRHTTISVPRVWGPFSWFGTRLIVMTRVRGHALHMLDWQRMSRSTQDSLIAQLHEFVSQLRAINPPPSPAICSVLGGPIYDSRIEYHPVGPFADEDEMNWYVRIGMPMEQLRTYSPICYEAHSRRHPLVLTHADLAPRNIMVDGDTVTGIIDWEMCGWYPAHWEYIKADRTCTNPAYKGWRDRIREFVPPFDLELAADQSVDPGGSCVGFARGSKLRYRSIVTE